MLTKAKKTRHISNKEDIPNWYKIVDGDQIRRALQKIKEEQESLAKIKNNRKE
ncbi:MAG: hypothetical protein ACPLSA_00130 [Caldanaerobacter sp.]